MTTKYLILEWIGHWAIPDHLHGGVNPGPHASLNEAMIVLYAYADKQAESARAPGPDGKPYRSATEVADERKLLLARHRILPVPQWPTDVPPGH